jgi:hypothetical protein
VAEIEANSAAQSGSEVMSMAELDAAARRPGNAAVETLRKALESADFRAKWLSQELAEVQGNLGRAQLEASELRRALAKLEGGESHEG